MIRSEILLTSINEHGQTITTWVLTMPKFILAEFNTHRVLSRSSASSRAIPLKKVMAEVREKPFIPIYWGMNESGMQAKQEASPEIREKAIAIWLRVAGHALDGAKEYQELGIHKQHANRLLEPWMFVNTIVTTTHYENFFALRSDEMAQPEFEWLADTMLEQYNNTPPKLLKKGEWHVPFGDKYCQGLTLEQKLKVATARCARVSYKNFDGNYEPEKDYDLYHKLWSSGHFSPFEMCACSADEDVQSGNFQGWIQYRKTIPNECRKDPRVRKWNVN
jgi:thymidylate synthase ThyX